MSPDSDKDITRRELITGGASLALASITSPALAAAAKVPQVPRRILGKTKQRIPILLVGGAVPLDAVFDPKLAEALRYGVDYFDAADCYSGGRCEPAVASFHTRLKNRKKLWITSKSDEHDPKGFEQRLGQSLQRLNTRYVDMYFLHALVDPAFLSRDLERLVAKLKKQGKLRFFGFSCHNANVVTLLRRAAELPWIDAVMFRYNFRRYGDRQLNKAIDACAKANVGLIAMKTQGSASSFRDKIAPFRKHGRWNRHQAVLKAVWADKRIAAAVSHMDTFEKLRQNIAAALDRRKLSRAELDELQRYAIATRATSCDGCDHLCSSALDAPVQIADTMRYLMYHDSYGEAGRAKQLYRALPQAARSLAWDFDAASQRCPNGLDIGWHMQRAAKVLG